MKQENRNQENKKAADIEQNFWIETKPITIWKVENGVLKEISIEAEIWIRKQPKDKKGRFIKEMVE